MRVYSKKKKKKYGIIKYGSLDCGAWETTFSHLHNEPSLSSSSQQ